MPESINLTDDNSSLYQKLRLLYGENYTLRQKLSYAMAYDAELIVILGKVIFPAGLDIEGKRNYLGAACAQYQAQLDKAKEQTK